MRPVDGPSSANNTGRNTNMYVVVCMSKMVLDVLLFLAIKSDWNTKSANQWVANKVRMRNSVGNVMASPWKSCMLMQCPLVRMGSRGIR